MAGWEQRRADVARTDGVASGARAVVAAAAFAASGGCLLATVLASLGAAQLEGAEMEQAAPPVAFATAYALVAVAWACIGA